MQTEHEDQVTEDQDVAAATEVEQVDEQPVDNGDSPDTDAADEPETFDRDYVERLRRENGRYRQRAQRADHYAQRLCRDRPGHRQAGRPDRLAVRRGASR